MAAGGPSSFVLIQKNQKIKSAERLLFAQGLCPANQAKPVRKSFRAFALLAHGPRFSKTCFPHAATQATIVLPDFSRSCSADGKKKNKTHRTLR
jgi:hypothetical protein